MGMASEKMESEATMHHMLRDNLYANRKQVELQGHLRYRKVNNIDADRISIDMKVNFTAFWLSGASSTTRKYYLVPVYKVVLGLRGTSL